AQVLCSAAAKQRAAGFSWVDTSLLCQPPPEPVSAAGGFGAAGSARPELLIQAQQTGAVVVDEFDLADELRDRCLLFQLLIDEPTQQRKSIDVTLLLSKPVKTPDSVRDSLLVS